MLYCNGSGHEFDTLSKNAMYVDIKFYGSWHTILYILSQYPQTAMKVDIKLVQLQKCNECWHEILLTFT